MSTRIHEVAFQGWFATAPKVRRGRAFRPRSIAAETRVLAALYAAEGGVRPASAIATAADVRAGTVAYLICRLRSAMDAEAIDTVPGVGYRLTEVGLAECRAALASFGEEVRAA